MGDENRMIRELKGKCPAFVLETEKSCYVLSVSESGHLEHLYYGSLISPDSAEMCDVFREKREFEPGNVIAYSKDHPTTVLEDMCLEMSSGGHGDIREPFIEVVRENGCRSSDFHRTSLRDAQRRRSHAGAALLRLSGMRRHHPQRQTHQQQQHGAYHH